MTEVNPNGRHFTAFVLVRTAIPQRTIPSARRDRLRKSVKYVTVDTEINLAAPHADVAKQQEPRPESRVEARYGMAGKAGWSPVPDVLLFNQHKLGINGDDLIVLLNLMMHYYVKDEMPFIRPTTIAKRMGVSQRKVQRSIARLRKQRLIVKGKHKENGQIIHDLTPLIDQLQPLGEERIVTRTAWQSQRSSTG